MSNQSPKPTAATSAKPVRRCPICRRPAADAVQPFCSPRCRDVDLHRWLSGSYVIPATEGDEDDVE
ncbi:DNA gyrase inhibitor YacG [Bradyrhizobium ontarionense]|uniref:DNA gyrase inhibitor YacG n=1 Tax=Bradyrhizobium ontarionense TaxID=2898149 RepID=A0ABY3R8G4_9BRAD|nr:DNA gyrase inhibitor YacG [Bradyrhizobium sp. A19]UFZ03052.1 DNA gyrase inhibitor YacG [Bradyrhizobium sp. A19]